MSSIRLTNELRTALKQLVVEKVDFPAEEKAVNDARKAMFKMFEDTVKARWPQKDMAVLDRYDCGASASFWCVTLPNGRRVAFGDLETVEHPFASKLRRPNRETDLHVDDAGAKLVEDFERVKAVLTARREKGHADYHALITNARTLEQVEKVWPAAKAVRTKFNRALPVIVLDDVIKRIVKDQAVRAAA